MVQEEKLQCREIKTLVPRNFKFTVILKEEDRDNAIKKDGTVERVQSTPACRGDELAGKHIDRESSKSMRGLPVISTLDSGHSVMMVRSELLIQSMIASQVESANISRFIQIIQWG